MKSTIALTEDSSIVTFQVSVPVMAKKDRDGDWFISYCPVLQIHAQGETEEKAIKNMKTTIRLFLLNCYKRGTLNQVLQECGYQACNEPVEVRKPNKHDHMRSIRISLPLCSAASPTQLAQCPA